MTRNSATSLITKTYDDEIIFSRSDNWRGNEIKEREVHIAIEKVIIDDFNDDTIDIALIFNIAKNQGEY